MLPAKATCGAGGSFGQPLKERSENMENTEDDDDE
jgi:hypothetical protein